MFTKAFALATLERAAKTFAQSLVALLVGSATGIVGTDWLDALNLAGMAAVLSVLTSIASGAVGTEGPSVGGETLTQEVAAVKASPAEAAEYVAGPAATVPEGEPVQVVPADGQVHDIEITAEGARLVTDYPRSADTKAEAAYHDPLDAPNEDYDPPAEPQGIVRHD